MAAAKGNKYGMQFSKSYQPVEKWTEEEALKLGFELIEWLKVETERGETNNIFVDKFLIVENDYYPQLVTYLKDKFKSFSYLYKKAQKMQEFKIAEGGLKNEYNTALTCFLLKNYHNMTDKQKVEHSGNITLTANVASQDDLDAIEELENV